MNKISKISNKVFYSVLVISLIFVIGIFAFEILRNMYLLVGSIFMFLLFPLLTISLIIILISNFKKLGFIDGLKESSINIFALILCSFLLWSIKIYAFEKNNRFNVKIINKTELGISNITLIGRNAKTKIDTLAPDKNQTVIFKGKRINYNTDNDYENEIRLLYYYDKKWRENKILSGFGRFRVIDNDWEIKILKSDSIEVKNVSQQHL